MIDNFEEILYINLADQSEKNTEFTRKVSKRSSILSENMRRFDAVNGKNLDIRIIDDDIITDHARKSITRGHQRVFGISMTYGALGCALSHMLIWQDYVTQSRPILVLEDDAGICEDFDLHLKNLLEHIEDLDYDVVYLGLHNVPHLNKKNIFSDLLYKPKGLACGTFGMIVSASGRKKLLEKIFPMNVQIDSCISSKKDQMNIYACRKELVSHSWEFGSRTQRKEGCKTAT